MIYALLLVIPLICMGLGRLAGMALPKPLGRLPEALLALATTLPWYMGEHSPASRLAGFLMDKLPIREVLSQYPDATLISGMYVLLGFVLWNITYWAIETGHGIAYTMGRNPKLAQGTRKQFLSAIVDPICKAFKKPLGSRWYSFLFMGMKGAWVGLTLFPCGLLLAVLWPQSYDLGWRMKEKGFKQIQPTAIGEYLSGLSLGCIVALAAALVQWLL